LIFGLIFLFLIAFSYGALGAAPSQKILKAASESSAAQPSAEPAAEIEDEFLDEELDFLDEEFEEEPVRIADPLSPWNRAMFHFNDKFYFWLLKPVAQGYKAVTPEIFRVGIRNFFRNLATPIRFVNSLLQGKGRNSGREMERFIINSTAGGLGFGDPAKKYHNLTPSDEDFGQTLGRYGAGNGFYIIWPFLGPSTLRDTVGLVGDRFLNPVTYVSPTTAAVGITGFRIVNETTFRIGDYESFKESALEPYVAFRDAYIQHRKKKVEE
jgi:phospholipid-binding lipoprotein MlaA